LSCTSLAYIIATSCAGQEQPTFPQDNFIWETWNTTYTMFAAYFDLGRNQVWRATDALGANAVNTRQATCIAPTGGPPTAKINGTENNPLRWPDGGYSVSRLGP
jgi:hypothetical protein